MSHALLCTEQHSLVETGPGCGAVQVGGDLLRRPGLGVRVAPLLPVRIRDAAQAVGLIVAPVRGQQRREVVLVAVAVSETARARAR